MKKIANIFFTIFYLLAFRSLYTYFFESQKLDDLRVGIIFILIFGSIHFLFFKLLNHQKRKEEKLRLYKDEIWKWRDDWRSRFAKPLNIDQVKFISFIIFTLVFGLVSLPVLENKKNEHLFIYIIPVIAAYSLIGALWQWRKINKFKAIKFSFNQDYFSLGGEIEGDLILPGDMRLSDTIHCTLTCFRLKYINRNNNSKLQRDNIWSHSWKQGPQTSSMLNTVKLRNDIPSDLPQTMPYRSLEHPTKTIKVFGKEYPYREKKGIEWILEVKSEMSGVDLFVQFEVPVIDSGDEELSRKTRDEIVSHKTKEARSFDFLTESISNGATIIDINTSRSLLVGLLMMLMGVVFAAPGLWLSYDSLSSAAGLANIMNLGKLLMGIVFSLIGLGIVTFSLGRFSFRGRMKLGLNSVKYESLGLFGQQRLKIKYDSIESVSVKSIFSMNDKNFHDLIIKRNQQNKKTRSFKLSLPSEFEVRYLKKLIEDKL